MIRKKSNVYNLLHFVLIFEFDRIFLLYVLFALKVWGNFGREKASIIDKLNSNFININFVPMKVNSIDRDLIHLQSSVCTSVNLFTSLETFSNSQLSKSNSPKLLSKY